MTKQDLIDLLIINDTADDIVDSISLAFNTPVNYEMIYRVVTIHSLLGCDSNGFCHYKSPSAMGKTHLRP